MFRYFTSCPINVFVCFQELEGRFVMYQTLNAYMLNIRECFNEKMSELEELEQKVRI